MLANPETLCEAVKKEARRARKAAAAARAAKAAAAEEEKEAAAAAAAAAKPEGEGGGDGDGAQKKGGGGGAGRIQRIHSRLHQTHLQRRKVAATVASRETHQVSRHTEVNI